MKPGEQITIIVPNLAYGWKFLYTFSGTIPALVGLIIQTRGLKTVSDTFKKQDLTNFWSNVVIVLLILMFIFFIHFIAKRVYTEDSMYPIVSAAGFSSVYGALFTGAGIFQ